MRKTMIRIVSLILVVIMIMGLVVTGLGSIRGSVARTYDSFVEANTDHFMSSGLPEERAAVLAQALAAEGLDAELTGIRSEDTGEFWLLNLFFADIDEVYHMYVDYDGSLFRFGSGEVFPEDLDGGDAGHVDLEEGGDIGYDE